MTPQEFSINWFILEATPEEQIDTLNKYHILCFWVNEHYDKKVIEVAETIKAFKEL